VYAVADARPITQAMKKYFIFILKNVCVIQKYPYLYGINHTGAKPTKTSHMTNTPKVQKAKVGVAGSLINQLMGNNATTPVVGEGATQLHYTDRTCYEVVEVSKDGKTARLQRLSARARLMGSSIGHQDWILEPTKNYMTIVWRHNAWYKVNYKIEYTEQYMQEYRASGASSLWSYINANPKLYAQVYGEDCEPVNVVEGVTREKKVYEKISIIFGVKDYHYDWSF
jgi:hypothetical protein